MRIHFANPMSKSFYIETLAKAKAQNCLFSYTLEDSKRCVDILNQVQAKNIIIDSGAFSAWTKKKEVDIDGYITFCQSLQNRLENIYFVNLDKIPGDFGRKPSALEIQESAELGWKNMLYIESKGVKVVHVFHQHEDFVWLDKLIDHQEYIGISPANDVSTKSRIAWLDRVFSRVRATRKTHGFGVTSKEIIMRYPWFSVDSNSWKAPCMWGRSSTLDLSTKGFTKNNKPGVFMKHELINEIKRWQKLQEEATLLWKKRGIEWE